MIGDEPRVSIDYLADHPRFVLTVAKWVFDHWGKMYRMQSVEEQIGRLSERLNKDAFPIAFVALVDGKPVGTASLKLREMTTYPHLEHWLGTVYVDEKFRGHGIGTALVVWATREAKRLGVETLYLHTPDKASFYRRLGWEPIERPVYFGMPVVVMRKVLRVVEEK